MIDCRKSFSYSGTIDIGKVGLSGNWKSVPVVTTDLEFLPSVSVHGDVMSPYNNERKPCNKEPTCLLR
jgi:hypothetical protein